jgi:hypothetical protein
MAEKEETGLIKLSLCLCTTAIYVYLGKERVENAQPRTNPNSTADATRKGKILRSRKKLLLNPRIQINNDIDSCHQNLRRNENNH